MNVQDLMRAHPRAGRGISNPLVECIERTLMALEGHLMRELGGHANQPALIR